LLISITSVLGYSPVVAYAAGQAYRDSPFILLLEYAPALTWLFYETCPSIWRRTVPDQSPTVFRSLDERNEIG
jgi:hypothetical protein